MDDASDRIPYSPPKQCGMPSIADLKKNIRATMLLVQAFRPSSLPATHAARTMVTSYVRLVERAIEEYEIARSCILSFVNRPSNGHLFSLFEAVDHMEVCISMIDRACNFLVPMREQAELKAVIPLLSVTSKKNRRAIAILRNASEHLETRLLKGRIKEGDYVMISVGEDACELEGTKITYAQLEHWLREMHALATCLASEGTVR